MYRYVVYYSEPVLGVEKAYHPTMLMAVLASRYVMDVFGIQCLIRQEKVTH